MLVKICASSIVCFYLKIAFILNWLELKYKIDFQVFKLNNLYFVLFLV